MTDKSIKEEMIVELGKNHKKIIDRFIPWFGNTTGEVLVNLSLRWIESNISNPNIDAVNALSIHLPENNIDTGAQKKTKYLRLGYRAKKQTHTPIGVAPERLKTGETKHK